MDERDYWHGLSALWGGSQTLVNVEHDMQVSDELIEDLLACPHPLCTHAYQLHHLEGKYAHRSHPSGDWANEGDEWCKFSGIGFCKITPEARVRPLESRNWSMVEISVSEACEGDWHIHWPGVAHHHTA